MLRPFKFYVQQKKVKRVAPDLPEAKGLIRTGVEDLETTINLITLSDENASYFFKNVYESVRSVLQANLAKAGYKPYSHEAIISFNLEEGIISNSEAVKLDKFRQIRNDLVYRAEHATVEEARALLELAETLIARLKEQN